MKKVLYVEDDEVNATVLKLSLQPFQYEVIWVNSLERGRQAAINPEFCALIFDLNLGYSNEDGIELMRTHRHDHSESRPIYALTAFGFPEDKKRVLDAGFDRYFTKPIDTKGIVEALNMDTLPSG
ncbi:MAG: response regulator [Bacteroidota bacterium]